MSDYISKQEAIQKVTEVELQDGTFADAKIKIGAIKTLNEKEIIRKAFERVVERLEKYKRANDMCRENAASAKRHENVRYFENLIFATEQAISMVKEEGGIE